MISTSYTSDGRSLNATIWLSHPLYGNQSNYGGPDGKLMYGIRIFLYNYTRPLYDVYIQQQSNGTWTKNAVEYDPFSNVSKPLEIHKYTALTNHGSRFINLSLDLDTIGFPDKYRVDSYVILAKSYPVNLPPTSTELCGLSCIFPSWPMQSFPFVFLATSYAVTLPPTIAEVCGLSCIVPSWPSIKVFPGQTSNISIPIKSTDYISTRSIDGERYTMHLQDNGSNYIRLSFSPNIIELPITGSTRTFLQITTPSDVASNNYTLSLFENFAHLHNGHLVSLTRIPTSLNIEVVKPKSINEQISQLSQILSTNIGDTVLVLLGTTLGIALPVLVYVWKKERQYIFMELSKSDILQINATVMVGVLILLTLGSLRHLTATIIGLITASIIFPFAVSSIMVIISKELSAEDKVKSSQLMNLKLFPASVMAMIIGFVYVIAAVITLAFVG